MPGAFGAVGDVFVLHHFSFGSSRYARDGVSTDSRESLDLQDRQPRLPQADEAGIAVHFRKALELVDLCWMEGTAGSLEGLRVGNPATREWVERLALALWLLVEALEPGTPTKHVEQDPRAHEA